ncbi:hypothetical protein [Anaerotardibacter muris]|nr:hypothetical protein [Anaerotardibacter muris]
MDLVIKVVELATAVVALVAAVIKARSMARGTRRVVKKKNRRR